MDPTYSKCKGDKDEKVEMYSLHEEPILKGTFKSFRKELPEVPTIFTNVINLRRDRPYYNRKYFTCANVNAIFPLLDPTVDYFQGLILDMDTQIVTFIQERKPQGLILGVSDRIYDNEGYNKYNFHPVYSPLDLWRPIVENVMLSTKIGVNAVFSLDTDDFEYRRKITQSCLAPHGNALLKLPKKIDGDILSEMFLLARSFREFCLFQPVMGGTYFVGLDYDIYQNTQNEIKGVEVPLEFRQYVEFLPTYNYDEMCDYMSVPLLWGF